MRRNSWRQMRPKPFPSSLWSTPGLSMHHGMQSIGWFACSNALCILSLCGILMWMFCLRFVSAGRPGCFSSWNLDAGRQSIYRAFASEWSLHFFGLYSYYCGMYHCCHQLLGLLWSHERGQMYVADILHLPLPDVCCPLNWWSPWICVSKSSWGQFETRDEAHHWGIWSW